jgi:hypothetical protein
MIARILILTAIGSLAIAAPLSKHIVRYQIQARLDPALRTIQGHETLIWLNDSPDTIPELRFHLYLNAFQNEKSTFIRESGGQLRGDRMSKDGWGYIDVSKLRITGGPDLSGTVHFVHPDDDNADDQTVAAVTLPKPVLPGKSITLDIDFVSKMPKVFARSGYHNEFYLVAQWFPKIGVWEKAGDRYATKSGWNCHQYHATSEFYADYGEFDVSITAPSRFVVGATGVQQSRSEDASRHETTYRFVQQDVHDFAWTASPLFLRTERQFDPAREVSPAELTSVAKLVGRPEAEVALKPVRMILLIQPEHREQIDRHFRALANALKWFGLWYGAYPYETITVVDPENGADGAGGMEYPTFITAGTPWRLADHETNPEEVVIHEFGHQYWYGMVGTNEFEESWLDEGFNQYSTSKIMDQVYAPFYPPIRFFTFQLGPLLGYSTYRTDQFNRVAYLGNRKVDPVVRNAWDYYDNTSYGLNSYMRPAILLRTMENYLGTPVMARVMRTWFERHRFHHPTSLDFRGVVNEVSGKDMNWFFDQFVFGTNTLDYRVASVASNTETIKRGLFPQGGKRTAVTDDDVDRIEKERSKKKEPDQYRSVVKLVRDGEAIFPVECKITLENGEVLNRQWDGRDRWIKYEFVKPSKVTRVEIDPEYKVLLDSNFANNSWVSKPARLPFVKWFSNMLFWSQMVLP